jgi:hypothetical protein
MPDAKVGRYRLLALDKSASRNVALASLWADSHIPISPLIGMWELHTLGRVTKYNGFAPRVTSGLMLQNQLISEHLNRPFPTV